MSGKAESKSSSGDWGVVECVCGGGELQGWETEKRFNPGLSRLEALVPLSQTSITAA